MPESISHIFCFHYRYPLLEIWIYYTLQPLIVKWTYIELYKWINDLVVGDKKLCGILTELAVEAESGQVQFVIIGVGINCNELTEDFSEDIQDRATSLFLQTGNRIDRNALAAELVQNFDQMISHWPDEHDWYLEQYCRWCSTTGRMIRIIKGNETETAFAERVNNSFGLVVKLADGSMKVLNSGEVTTRNA